MLLSQLEGNIVVADNGFDADQQLFEPLQQAGEEAVIPSKANRSVQREDDKELYKARYLIVSFLSKLKLFRAIATRHGRTARNFLAAIRPVADAISVLVDDTP